MTDKEKIEELVKFLKELAKEVYPDDYTAWKVNEFLKEKGYAD